MPRAGLRNSLVVQPRVVEGKGTIGVMKDGISFFLETSPIAKQNRKRTRKVLHPIATDTEIDKDVSSSSPSLLADSVCASPARRARLLHPRM